MAKIRKIKAELHQVTIDEYIESQKELFPDEPPKPAQKSYTGPWRVRGSAPVFPGAVDTKNYAEPAKPVQVVRSFGKNKIGG